MFFDLLKNPIVIGLILGTITYLYLYWENKKKKEKNDKIVDGVNYYIPIAVAILGWFIAYNIFGKWNTTIDTANIQPTSNIQQGCGPVNNPVSDNIKNNDVYHVATKNTIRLPQTDVFIDIAKF